MAVILAALVLVILIAVLIAAPLAFLAMLFLGNIGVHLGFWQLLPGALALKIALSNNTTNTTK